MLLELPSLGNIPPPSGVFGYSLAALQTFVAVTSFSNESSDPTPYSKFAAVKDGKLEDPISSKDGMLRIYAPSTIVACLFMLVSDMKPVTPLLLVHFVKRLFEVVAVHKYSGTMPSKQANAIGTYYALLTLMIISFALPFDKVDSDLQNLGLCLFTVGSLGNLYHHWLLSGLRSESKKTDSSKKRYIPPRGGLFSFVAAPHYLFEVIAWLGIGLVAQQTNAMLVVASMASYLSGRARATNKFYLDTFTDQEWPRSRKAIFPGLL
jgi:protein-S-isoprenylcysteine O-methyltransferase Ste14